MLHTSMFPLTTSASPAIGLATCDEHRAVVSEASIVADNKGIAGCHENDTKCCDVMVRYIVMNMIQFDRAGVPVMMLVPPTTVKGSTLSRACQFLTLRRAMKATEMAN